MVLRSGVEILWQRQNCKESLGVYLICDNGYISWPTTICPYMCLQTNNRLEDFFSTNLEIVQKDVECVFGILKSCWTPLNKGFKYC
jgi:hypothetical protein